jgi:hypothetical protein
MSKPQGLLRPEGLGKLIKIIHLIGSRTGDLPVCNIAPYLVNNCDFISIVHPVVTLNFVVWVEHFGWAVGTVVCIGEEC